MRRRKYPRKKYFRKSNPGLQLKNHQVKVRDQQTYLGDYISVPAQLTDKLSTISYRSDEFGTSQSLLYQGAGAFDRFKNFSFKRICWVRLKFIPQRMLAATYTAGGTTPVWPNGEVPRIHWIQDNGQLHQALMAGGASDDWNTVTELALAKATQISGYKQLEFTRPVTIWVKPFVLDNNTNTTRSYSKWRSTTNDSAIMNPPVLQSTTAPGIVTYGQDIRCLHLGFSNIPSGFTYKVESTTCWAYKGWRPENYV